MGDRVGQSRRALLIYVSHRRLLVDMSYVSAVESSHPSFSQGTLQVRQLGSGTPGLSNQTLVSDGGAAQI